MQAFFLTVLPTSHNISHPEAWAPGDEARARHLLDGDESTPSLFLYETR